MSARFLKNLTPAKFPKSTKFALFISYPRVQKHSVKHVRVYPDAAHTEDQLGARITFTAYMK